MSSGVRSGLDRVLKSWPRRLAGSRVGLVVHPASVNKNLIHASISLSRCSSFRLAAFFGPQHGIRGETQDNMIEWEGFRDEQSGLPVYSLYGQTRKPDAAMLRDVDVMVIDLQDVGSRYYTFIWTAGLIMEACMESGKAVVILDRPNPITGTLIEGPVVEPAYRSFVGMHSLPARHGMTMGEIATYLRALLYSSLDLTIVPLKGWRRRMWFDQAALPWVMPSPNMPTLDTATVYPGMCLLEGTNLSEGRGTTRPFEIFGAPFIDPVKLERRLRLFRLPGVLFRPIFFQPTFQKHSGSLCGGCQIHVLDRDKFKPFLTSAAIIKAIHELYPDDFSWKQPPYEYEERLLPIDILAGSDRFRASIESDIPLREMASSWRTDCNRFDRDIRSSVLLYK